MGNEVARQKLETLLRSAGLEAYRPVPPLVGWIDHLYRIVASSAGIAALLGPSGLRMGVGGGNGNRIIPEPLVVTLAGIASHLTASSKKIAVSLPPTARHLPLLFAAVEILNSVLVKSIDDSLPNGGKVLIVSPDLDLRYKYLDLFVKKEPLKNAYPGARLRPNGGVVSLGNAQGEDFGYCFVLPIGNPPNEIDFKPSLIVLDLRYSRLSNLAERTVSWVSRVGGKAGAIALRTLGDAQAAEILNACGYSDLPLDHHVLRACRERWQIKNDIGDPERLELSVTPVADALIRRHKITTIAAGSDHEKMVTDVAQLLNEYESFDLPDIWRARWILGVLATMPVPPIWYDNAASELGRYRISNSIRRLGSRSQNVSGVGPLFQTLRIQFEKIYQHLSVQNVRAVAFKEAVRRICRPSPEKSIVVVRDNVTLNALERWLRLDAFPGEAWTDALRLVDYRSFSALAGTRFSGVLFNGPLQRRYRWILGSRLGDYVEFVAFPSESKYIRQQLEHFYAPEVVSDNERKRTESAAKLWSRTPQEQSTDYIKPYELLLDSDDESYSAKMSPVRQPKATSVRDLSELANALASKAVTEKKRAIDPSVYTIALEEEGSDEAGMEGQAIEELGNVSGYAAKVQSTRLGMQTCHFVGERYYDTMRLSESEAIRPLRPMDFRVGDLVLLVDSAGRESVFERVVEMAESMPEIQYLQRFRQTWRSAIAILRKSYSSGEYVDYGTLTRNLQKEGAEIETEIAVRFWLDNHVIGPSAVKSIEAVGKLSGLSVLIKESGAFDAAFRQIRAIHQSIGRRIAGAIRKSFRNLVGADGSPEFDRVQERIGLAVDEVLESLDVVEILEIDRNARVVQGSLFDPRRKD